MQLLVCKCWQRVLTGLEVHRSTAVHGSLERKYLELRRTQAPREPLSSWTYAFAIAAVC